jgi:hypothetical protein
MSSQITGWGLRLHDTFCTFPPPASVAPPAGPSNARRSDTIRHTGRVKLVRTGLALFAVGVVFILIDVIPFFLGAHNRPLWLNLACLAAPVGFGIAVFGGLRRGWQDQREALRRVPQQ